MSRCRNDLPRAPSLPVLPLPPVSPSWLYPSLFLSFFNQPFPSSSGRVSLTEADALTSPLSGLSYGHHYRRAHAPISHFRFSELRSGENLRERAIIPRASLAYTTIFFDQGFYYVRERFSFLQSQAGGASIAFRAAHFGHLVSSFARSGLPEDTQGTFSLVSNLLEDARPFRGGFVLSWSFSAVHPRSFL